ncbi:Hint domain-containing protein [Defluviimonas sp. WL0002]|uniref:Hint domain-containing protein n=1 Tax=Albidovulum marisflavi TaxID=2984159 RepID=A0ABT2ZFJ1_9RHOB|nr:Hint domain-containing protein [Defluviimonas sp. WL0002]MCV2869808.1 Hint domain-containing protein [Defluviimonas sp. WL0002]
MTDPEPPPAQFAHVYPATAFRVVLGANQGDPIGAADNCELGDVYRLAPESQSSRLALRLSDSPAAPQVVGPGTRIGTEGDTVTLLSLLTLVAANGDRVEVLILRHDPSDEILALPLSPLSPRADHTLVSAAPPPPGLRIAETVCVAFARGTLISLPEAAPLPIEQLAPGDRVLTRDHGAQVLRWTGKATFPAQGGFAPVVIAAGAMGNLGDLAVSPHHRLFLYASGVTPTADLLVQAKHLVDGDRITRREGGFVDYYSLVFDRHEIIYAEGIPSESLNVTQSVMPMLPTELSDELRARFPGLDQHAHAAIEIAQDAVPSVAAHLRDRGR